MTGYGKATATLTEKILTIEIKSLNSKFLDLILKLPHLFREKEIEIRQLLAEKLVRGRVEVIVNFEYLNQNQGLAIHQPTANNYQQQLTQLANNLNLPIQNISAAEWLRLIMPLPNVLTGSKEELTNTEYELFKQTLHQALNAFFEFRKQEGNALANDLTQAVKAIIQHLAIIEQTAPQRTENIRNNLRTQITDFLAQNTNPNTPILDTNRFEQELFYYIERLDINEEITRLHNHCQYFITELNTTNEIAKGKKLNFIAQEMGREINTIGSKANHTLIQTKVVGMKDELEKIKEQTQNLI